MRSPVRSHAAAVATAALAVVLAVGAGACAGGKPDGFGKETEATFVRVCAHPSSGTGLPEDVCRCAYVRITRAMSFDEYERLDDKLQAAEQKTGEPHAVPDVVADAFAACSGDPTDTTDTSDASDATTTTRKP